MQHYVLKSTLPPCLTYTNIVLLCTGNEVVTVKTPAFAESVTEGDVRWEKGWYLLMYDV